VISTGMVRSLSPNRRDCRRNSASLRDLLTRRESARRPKRHGTGNFQRLLHQRPSRGSRGAPTRVARAEIRTTRRNPGSLPWSSAISRGLRGRRVIGLPSPSRRSALLSGPCGVAAPHNSVAALVSTLGFLELLMAWKISTSLWRGSPLPST